MHALLHARTDLFVSVAERVVAVREMARHRYRQAQLVGLTRLQLDAIGRERELQRRGAQQAEAWAERSVELAQAYVVPAFERRA